MSRRAWRRLMRFWRQSSEVVFSVGVGGGAWATVVATGDSCLMLDAGGARWWGVEGATNRARIWRIDADGPERGLDMLSCCDEAPS